MGHLPCLLTYAVTAHVTRSSHARHMHSGNLVSHFVLYYASVEKWATRLSRAPLQDPFWLVLKTMSKEVLKHQQLDQPHSQALSSLPPLVVGCGWSRDPCDTKTLSTGVDSTNRQPHTYGQIHLWNSPVLLQAHTVWSRKKLKTNAHAPPNDSIIDLSRIPTNNSSESRSEWTWKCSTQPRSKAIFRMHWRGMRERSRMKYWTSAHPRPRFPLFLKANKFAFEHVGIWSAVASQCWLDSSAVRDVLQRYMNSKGP